MNTKSLSNSLINKIVPDSFQTIILVDVIKMIKYDFTGKMSL